MVQTLTVRVDVTAAVGLGELLETVATVVLPDDPTMAEAVCFAFPGGGYSRGYYTFDMPNAVGGGQAGWHAANGWIFVACDHLSVGESSAPSDVRSLNFENLAAANHATVLEIMRLLRSGAVGVGVSPILDPIVIGIGQSMGGCLTVVQQGQYGTYDGIGVLGYSATHTVLPMPPGSDLQVRTGLPRGQLPAVYEHSEAFGQPEQQPTEAALPPTTWGFHYDDVPRDIVVDDMVGFPSRGNRQMAWASHSIPPCAMQMTAPGTVAPEAAVITAPVLIALGERDVSTDPWSEAKAYKSTTDVTLYICPKMGHMHNFASSRELLWQRIHSWGEGVINQIAATHSSGSSGATIS